MNTFRMMAAVVAASVVFSSATATAGDAEKRKEKREARKDKEPGERRERRFNKIDTNDDGQISLAEFVAFHQAHHGRRKGLNK